jgi:hypothetical protein
MSHALGVADGKPGLPFMNWSTERDDLRIAHFIGIDAMQIIPSVGDFLSRPSRAQWTGRPVTWLWVLALGYGFVALLLCLHALAGRPSIRMEAQCLVGEDLTHSHKIGIVLETGPCGRQNSGAVTTSPMIRSAPLPKASDNPVALSGAYDLG